MSDYRILYTRPDDGGVSIIVPAPGVARAEAVKAVPLGLAYEIVDAAEVPSDRTFRNAWERNGRACEVNLPKAREIAHQKRRAARAAEFAPLDVQATIPAQAAAAEAARQAIRDKYTTMQTAIDAAATVEDLKAAAAGVL